MCSLCKGRTIRYLGGEARVFVGCKLFFTLERKQYCFLCLVEELIMSYAFPIMYVTIVGCFFQVNYDNKLFLFCQHFQKTFFQTCVATNLFSYFLPPSKYLMVHFMMILFVYPITTQSTNYKRYYRYHRTIIHTHIFQTANVFLLLFWMSLGLLNGCFAIIQTKKPYFGGHDF